MDDGICPSAALLCSSFMCAHHPTDVGGPARGQVHRPERCLWMGIDEGGRGVNPQCDVTGERT